MDFGRIPSPASSLLEEALSALETPANSPPSSPPLPTGYRTSLFVDSEDEEDGDEREMEVMQDEIHQAVYNAMEAEVVNHRSPFDLGVVDTGHG